MTNKDELMNDNEKDDHNDYVFDKLYKIQKLLKKESALKELCN